MERLAHARRRATNSTPELLSCRSHFYCLYLDVIQRKTLTQTFTLDSKGGAKTAAGSLKILSKGTANRTGKFTLKLSRGAFATKFVDEGLTNAAARFKDVNITVTVLFNSKLFQTVQAQSYTGKAGRGGSTKDKK